LHFWWNEPNPNLELKSICAMPSLRCPDAAAQAGDYAVTQNIYDDENFFEGYSGLSRSIDGLDAMPEWPALKALLPDLRGMRVLDLGCGFGWFCRWARQNGAAQVLGIDVSEKMLARARETTKDEAVGYRRADLETLDLSGQNFGLVYSALVLHYIADLAGLLGTIRRSLVQGGRFVTSVEHPLFTAPAAPGWTVTPEGRKSWPVDRYLEEGPRSTNWLAEGVIKQHRTFATYINLLLQAGFSIAHVEEWGPTDAQIAAQPSLADERQRPTFLLLAATAPK
jgi:ubiquinone/menaquinone biosynthesis C-methylase UbiE